MERLEISILDINKKSQVILEKEKKELINRANLIASVSNAEIISVIEDYKQKLVIMYKNNYPVYKIISFRELSIQKLAAEIGFNNGDTIIVPYFNNTKHWIKVVIGDKEDFLKYLYEKGFLNSFTIICPNNGVIYDIEVGEQEYEIRICDC